MEHRASWLSWWSTGIEARSRQLAPFVRIDIIDLLLSYNVCGIASLSVSIYDRFNVT